MHPCSTALCGACGAGWESLLSCACPTCGVLHPRSVVSAGSTGTEPSLTHPLCDRHSWVASEQEPYPGRWLSGADLVLQPLQPLPVSGDTKWDPAENVPSPEGGQLRELPCASALGASFWPTLVARPCHSPSDSGWGLRLVRGLGPRRGVSVFNYPHGSFCVQMQRFIPGTSIQREENQVPPGPVAEAQPIPPFLGGRTNTPKPALEPACLPAPEAELVLRQPLAGGPAASDSQAAALGPRAILQNQPSQCLDLLRWGLLEISSSQDEPGSCPG